MFKYILILLATLSLASCTNTSNTPLQTDQTSNQQTSQALYVDVRETDEGAAGHIEWAIHVPLGQIEAGDYSKIPKDTPVKVYCHSGRRSGLALEALKKAGYINVSNAGGMTSMSGVKVVK